MAQLENAKRVAEMLLYLDIEETAFAPIAVLHPFFESALLCDTEGVFNALEETERYFCYLQFFYRTRIAPCASIKELLYCVRKSYRLTYLKLLMEQKVITVAECGNLLASVWDMIECINYDANVSKRIVLKWIKAADKAVLMDSTEQKVYAGLLDVVHIYRGCADKASALGMSWTLNKDKAEWFASRFNQGNKVFEADIDKQNIIGYLNRRNEQEVIVDYTKLRNIRECSNVVI